MGVICFGDYEKQHTSYLIKTLDLTESQDRVVEFVNTVGDTPGSWFEEAYEVALNAVTRCDFRENSKRIFILIGDSIPHEPSFPLNTLKLDWRVELDRLNAMKVQVFPIQALNHPGAPAFYQYISAMFDTPHLKLEQFHYVVDMIVAVCYSAYSPDSLQAFEASMNQMGKLNVPMQRVIHQLRHGRADTTFVPRFSSAPSSSSAGGGFVPVPPGRFQVLRTSPEAQSIKEFVLANSLNFKVGRGFYELTKPEDISSKKEIILQNVQTDDMYTGEAARTTVGIPLNAACKFSPAKFDTSIWRVFVQSTSYNRKLMPNTMFLYELEVL